MSDPASAAEHVVSKGEFARLANVTPGRVSQWLAAGQISGDALVGEGRNARIHVEHARAQLRLKLDFGQRLGNGLSTRLEGPASGSPALVARDGLGEGWRPPPADPVEEQIKRERLATLQATNRRVAEEELARRGTYVRADAVRPEMTRLAIGLLNVFEGALPDMASALSARFEIAQRDVLHVLRTAFREVRVKAASEAGRRGEALPELVAEEVADATDPAQGEA